MLLQQEFEYTEKQLRRSYRVPSEILNYAKQFLDASKVMVAPSEPFLERPGSLSFLETSSAEQSLKDAVVLAEASLMASESLLIIASTEDRQALQTNKFLDNGNAYVRIMDPTEVKGLEFDAVIIVNPEKVLEDYEWGKSRQARLF